MIITLFAEFFHANKGETCTESSLIDLSDNEECSDAVKYALSFNVDALYGGEVSFSEFPKGCSIYDDGIMYFNSHSTGTKANDALNICKKGIE